MKRLKTWICFLFLAVLSYGGYKIARVATFAFAPAQPGTDSSNVHFVSVTSGQSAWKLTESLHEKGLIKDTYQFHRLGRLLRKWKELKVGEYQVSASMTPIEIFSVLTSGKSVAHPTTFQEGLNIYQIANILEERGLVPASEFVQLCKSQEMMKELGFQPPYPPSLEGYLFPETYYFNRGMNARSMIRLMHQGFQQNWGVNEEQRARELGMNRHEVITLASIIEKETGAPEERPLISSVFHNRLNKRMRLQSDPTTIYGMWERYDGNIRKKDLKDRNPFNTYVIRALPIGPIANPGKKAIEAALYPEKSDYLFFVSKNDGTHQFTRNFREHQAAVREYQLDRRARQGKSWRDRLKKEQD